MADACLRREMDDAVRGVLPKQAADRIAVCEVAADELERRVALQRRRRACLSATS